MNIQTLCLIIVIHATVSAFAFWVVCQCLITMANELRLFRWKLEREEAEKNERR